jgi:hypothetical protein
LAVASFAPGVTCESVAGVEDWTDCGFLLGLGLKHQSEDGRFQIDADVDLTRVGPRRDTSLSLALEHKF